MESEQHSFFLQAIFQLDVFGVCASATGLASPESAPLLSRRVMWLASAPRNSCISSSSLFFKSSLSLKIRSRRRWQGRHSLPSEGRASCPQISEAYVVRRGTSGHDDALKSCLRLPVLWSEAAHIMKPTP